MALRYLALCRIDDTMGNPHTPWNGALAHTGRGAWTPIQYEKTVDPDRLRIVYVGAKSDAARAYLTKRSARKCVERCRTLGIPNTVYEVLPVFRQITGDFTLTRYIPEGFHYE